MQIFGLILSLLVSGQQAAAFNPNPEISDSEQKEMREFVKGLRCPATFWTLWLPVQSTRIADLKNFADKIGTGNDVKKEITQAENFLLQSGATCENREYDKSVEDLMQYARRGAIYFLINHNILPVLVQQNYDTGYDWQNVAFDLQTTAISKMNEKQKVQYWINSVKNISFNRPFGNYRDPYANDWLERLLKVLPFAEMENFKDEPGVWRALFSATGLSIVQSKDKYNKHGAFTNRYKDIKKARETVLGIKDINDIKKAIELAVPRELSIEELFTHFAKEVSLLNENEPMFLPQFIAESIIAKGREMPSLDLSALSPESRAAYGSFSRSASSYAQSGGGSGGSGTSSVKIYSEWERREISRLLAERGPDALIRSRVWIGDSLERIQFIKSNRLKAVESLRAELDKINFVCQESYGQNNIEIYGICTKALSTALKALSEIAKQDPDVAAVLRLYTARPSIKSFLEIISVSDKLPGNRARLEAVKKVNLSAVFSDDPKKNALTYRRLLGAKGIERIQALVKAEDEEIRKAVEKQKQTDPKAQVAMRYSLAREIIHKLDEPLVDGYVSSSFAQWIVLPEALTVKLKGKGISETDIKVTLVRVSLERCSEASLIRVGNLDSYRGSFSDVELRNMLALNVCVDDLNRNLSSGLDRYNQDDKFIRSLDLVDDNSQVVVLDQDVPPESGYPKSKRQVTPNSRNDSPYEQKSYYSETSEERRLKDKAAFEKGWEQIILLDKVVRAMTGSSGILNVQLPSPLETTKLKQKALLVGQFLEEKDRTAYREQDRYFTTEESVPKSYKSLGEAYLMAKEIKP